MHKRQWLCPISCLFWISGIAVICGSNVLIYRNCRPYFKFSLPGIEWNGLEADCWQNKPGVERLVSLLRSLSLQFGYSNLSTQSQTILNLNPFERELFLSKIRKIPSHKQVLINLKLLFCLPFSRWKLFEWFDTSN